MQAFLSFSFSLLFAFSLRLVMAYQYFVQYRFRHSSRCFEYVMYSELPLLSFKEWLTENPLVDPAYSELVNVAILR